MPTRIRWNQYHGIKPVVKDGYLVSSGETPFLAADDKAGIAATIMEAYDYVKGKQHPHRRCNSLLPFVKRLNMMGIKTLISPNCPRKISTSSILPAPLVSADHEEPAKRVGIVATFTGKRPMRASSRKRRQRLLRHGQSHRRGALRSDRPGDHLNVGRVEGGGQTNVVSDSAFFTAEIRSHSAETLEAEIEKVRKSCEEAAAAFRRPGGCPGQLRLPHQEAGPGILCVQNSAMPPT